MRLNMDRKGNVVASGEGVFTIPTNVSHGNMAVGNPAETAENLRSKERQAAKQAKEVERQRKEQLKQEKLYMKERDKAAKAQARYEAEALQNENSGEHPLMYLAALQSMNGECREFNHPLNGYGLSTDGVPAYDRAMGFSFSDITSAMSNVQSIAQSAEQTIQSVVRVVKPAPAPQPIVQSVTEIVQAADGYPVVTEIVKPGLMNIKVAGVPIVYLVGGGVASLAVLMLLMRRR